jgi:hypothetical protein
MDIHIRRTNHTLSGGQWYVGRIGAYQFEAVVFTESSQYGIDAGQVSKLWLLDGPRQRGGTEVVAYDRGWDVEPDSDTLR